MNGDLKEEIVRRIEAARVAFIHRARRDRQRLQEIRTRIDDDAGAVDDPMIAELHHLAHRLHGTAGTFGFDEVSAAARDLERMIGDHGAIKDAGGPTRPAVADLAQAIDRVDRALGEAGAGETGAAANA